MDERGVARIAYFSLAVNTGAFEMREPPASESITQTIWLFL